MTTQWTREAVLRASADWVWTPEGTREAATDDYRLVAYPAWTGFPPEVVRCRARSAGTVIGTVTEQVRAWGSDRVTWRVAEDTEPADLEEHLRRRGAEPTETVDVLALDLAGGMPELGPHDGVRCVLVDDEATVRAAAAVATEVWGTPPLDEERLAHELAALEQASAFKVVGYVDDEPVVTGGCTLADGVARLWGAATRPEHRGRGAYRAALARRLAVARDRGASLALVKGRVETSGPILRRAGFAPYGQERQWLLML